MASSELQDILDLLKRRAEANEGRQLRVHQRRAAYDELGMSFADLDGITVTEDVDAGGVSADWLVASDADSDNVMLYLHGGGYVIGSPISHRGLAANLSRVTKSRVLVLDYRLAPESSFPAPVDDAVAAYRWLIESGFDASNISVAGDSAGGGLAVAMLVAVRKVGLPLPAAGICISPWVDMEGIGESMTMRAHTDPQVQREGLLNFAKLYLNTADPRSPMAAPIYADLTGLPPLLIQVGTAETLYDDSTRLEAHAKEAGVEVVMEGWEDMIHVWHTYAPKLPEATQAIERIGEFVRERLGSTVASAE